MIRSLGPEPPPALALGGLPSPTGAFSSGETASPANSSREPSGPLPAGVNYDAETNLFNASFRHKTKFVQKCGFTSIEGAAQAYLEMKNQFSDATKLASLDSIVPGLATIDEAARPISELPRPQGQLSNKLQDILSRGNIS